MPDTDLEKARSYAIRLIKFRARTQKEIREKLLSRDYEPSVVDEVVARLLKAGLLDDALFARLWVQSRIKKPLGLARLRRELLQKGVGRDIVEGALEQARAGYDERAVIRQTIVHKSEGMRGISLDKKRARLFGYLARRGFSRDRIMEALFETL